MFEIPSSRAPGGEFQRLTGLVRAGSEGEDVNDSPELPPWLALSRATVGYLSWSRLGWAEACPKGTRTQCRESPRFYSRPACLAFSCPSPVGVRNLFRYRLITDAVHRGPSAAADDARWQIGLPDPRAGQRSLIARAPEGVFLDPRGEWRSSDKN